MIKPNLLLDATSRSSSTSIRAIDSHMQSSYDVHSSNSLFITLISSQGVCGGVGGGGILQICYGQP